MRNVEVGAFPTLRGVKCCWRVLKAGLLVFLGSSGLEPAALPSLPCVASGLAFVLAVRLSPAIRIDVLAGAGAVSADAPCVFELRLGAIRKDFDRSEAGIDLGASFLAADTVTADFVRAWPAIFDVGAGCEVVAGFRRDCVRLSPTACGSPGLLTEVGGRIERGAVVPSLGSARCKDGVPLLYAVRARRRPGTALGAGISCVAILASGALLGLPSASLDTGL